jgi:arylsulfatase A-like enzyme
MKRFLAAALVALGLVGCAKTGGNGDPNPTPTPTSAPLGPLSFVVILADDMGYGDLGVYGNTTIKTPNIDQLAAGGARFTSFYVTSPVCAPSRASLLTGRWAPRTGIPWNPPVRLNDDEVTLADVLRQAGYATGMVGKWHLGWESRDMPTRHGFDSYYGFIADENQGGFWRDDRPTSDGVGFDLLTERYTQEAVSFIRAQQGRPFFLYLAHRSPHLDLYPHPAFQGKSAGGAYGDVVEELDWSVGEVLKALRETGAERNTLVFFLSDNGPPAPAPLHAQPELIPTRCGKD